MNEYNVTVIIPVYNVERYLKDCIDSVVNQTLGNIEVLLVDDGSTDTSGDICDQYAKEHGFIKAFHKKNGGQGSARNFAIQYVSGEYIYFLDSDDWIVENALERLYYESKKNELDLIAFSADVFYDDDTLVEKNRFDYQRINNIGVVCSGVESLKKAIAANEYMTSVCLRLYNTEYYKKNNFLFDENYIHEDEDFGFLSYMLADRVEIISDSLYKRRVRANSTMTGRTTVKSVDGYYNAWSNLDKFRKSTEDAEKKELCERKMLDYSCAVFDMYHLTDRKTKKIIHKKCKCMCQSVSGNNVPKKFKIARFSLKMCDWLLTVMKK